MDIDIAKKVNQLKNSFTVEGTPLFKSDRFSEDEIAQMKKENDCHSSHWYGFSKNSKIWSDKEIATQVEVFFATPNVNETKFKEIVDKLSSALPLNDIDKERKVFREILFGVLNWTEEKNGISGMWAKFGSAPSADGGGFHGNKKLEKYSKMYGACSMHEIFDGQFSNKFHIFWYGANNALSEFDNFWLEAKRKKDLASEIFTSPYNSLDEIEDNVVVKKIQEAAKTFYLDKTKDFEERVRVFSKHGEKEGCIFEPSDKNLNKIFQYDQETEHDRHSIVYCIDVIESWIYNLKRYRCHLDWTNPYHPDLKAKPRNYKPSKEAIDRLYRYYIEKLFLEGVGSFEFDW